MNPATKTKWIVSIALSVFAISLVSFLALLYFHSQAEEELRENLIVNCERNGNPLREVLQRRIQKEIENDKNVALLRKVLPNTPPKVLETLAKKDIKQLKQEEKEIGPIHCMKQYEH